jgi:HPt (histidine-containing phosphotransfer) domain-containing protein
LRWTLIAIASIWLAAAMHLHEQRAEGVQALRATAEGMADGASEALSRQLRNIDQTLLYVRALYARDCEAFDLEPWVHSAEAADRRVWPIVVAGSDGLVTYSDLRRVSSRVDVSNLQAFRHFAQPASAHLDDHLFIGKPVPGRYTEPPAIPFARPLMTPLGGFGGIAMVSLDAGALVPEAPYVDATVTVTGLDGVVRATLRGQVRPGSVSTSSVLRRAASRSEGSFVTPGADDGAGGVTGFRRVDGFPLLVEVVLPVDPEVIGLGSDRGMVGAGVFVLSLIILFAGVRCERHRPTPSAVVRVAAIPEPVAPPNETAEAERPAARAVVKEPAAAASHVALEHLVDAVGTGAVAGIVTSFLDGLPRQLGRMHALAEAGDLDTLMREARALASNAAAIGLDQLAAAASELEQDARYHAPVAIAARLDRIELLARPATARLDAYLHERAA